MSVLPRPLVASLFCFALALPGCEGTAGRTGAKTDAKTAKAKAPAKKAAPTPVPQVPEVTPKSPSAPVLTLGAAKLMQEGKPDEVLELLADGGIKISGRPLATLSTDGKLTGPEGKVVLEVGPDGKVTSSGRPVGLELTEEGGRVMAGQTVITMTFEDDGSVKVEPSKEGSAKVTHEGCNGPVGRSCALLMFGMLATVGDSGPQPGPEAKAAPAPEAKAAPDPAPEAKAPSWTPPQ